MGKKAASAGAANVTSKKPASAIPARFGAFELLDILTIRRPSTRGAYFYDADNFASWCFLGYPFASASPLSSHPRTNEGRRVDCALAFAQWPVAR